MRQSRLRERLKYHASPLSIVLRSASAFMPSPTATPLPTATPVPTPKPTPVPWKSYTSKKYHYKIQYPPTWVVTPGSGTFSDQFDGYDYPYVWIYRDTVSSGSIASPSLTATHDIAYNKSHYKAKLISNKSIKVNGWSGRIVTMRGVDNGVKVEIVDLLIAKGRVGYGLEMWGHVESAPADLALFKRMYGTWRPT